MSQRSLYSWIEAFDRCIAARTARVVVALPCSDHILPSARNAAPQCTIANVRRKPSTPSWTVRSWRIVGSGGLCLAGDHDQSTPRRSSRSSGTGTLGGRPHPRSWQSDDRHPGRAHDALHDAAASSRLAAHRSSEERTCARGTRAPSSLCPKNCVVR